MGLFAALLTATGVLVGSGGSGASTPAAPATAWLSSIPDTPAYRSEIAVNDLQTLWTSAGLAFPPTLAQLGTAPGLAAFRQIAGGSQLGSSLLLYAPVSTDLLGYDALAIRSEVSAGMPPGLLSVVQGPIDASKVGAELAALGVRPVSTGAIVRYSIGNALNLSGEAAGALVSVRTLAVLGLGGRAAAGGPTVPPGDVVNLLRGRHPTPSLASDPDVRQMLELLGGADVMLFGTGLVASWDHILGHQPSPLEVAQTLRTNPGLDRLSAAPTLAGYGYLPGSPTHATALAVAIYANPSDAKGAANIFGDVLRAGYSTLYAEHYARLFAVDTITVEGDAVVARLTERSADAVAQATEEDNMPLFWSPPPKG
jgi:hypothetical protein